MFPCDLGQHCGRAGIAARAETVGELLLNGGALVGHECKHSLNHFGRLGQQTLAEANRVNSHRGAIVFEGLQELVFRVDMDISEYKFCGFDDTFDDTILTFFRERHKIFRHIFDFLLHYAQSIFIHYNIEIDLSLCPISIKIQKKGRDR